MLFFISYLSVGWSLFKKKSKFLSGLICTIIIILFFGNTSNADFGGYFLNYELIKSNNISLFSFEPGFQFFSTVVAFLGLTYNQFLLIFSTVGMSLIVITIKRYTKNVAYVLALYFIYPFVIDTVQIRNFMAMAIIIYSLRYIVSTKTSWKKYVIGVCIASTFHISSLFYLAFLMVKFLSNKNIYIITSLAVFFSLILSNSFFSILISFIPTDKNGYFLTDTSFNTKLSVLAYFGVSLLILHMFVKTRKFQLKNNELLSKKSEAIEPDKIFAINVICALSIILVLNNLNFIRLYRNIFIFNYTFFAMCFENHKSTYKNWFLSFSSLFISVISFIIFIDYLTSADLVSDLFNNRLFFSK